MSDNQLGRRHHQRLREIYRSAGWPSQDMIEVELLAAGLLERAPGTGASQDTLRVTDAGVATLAQVYRLNQAARSDHEILVERVALAMLRAGRLVWRGLMLRAPLAGAAPVGPALATVDELPGMPVPSEGYGALRRWVMASPDVFSIRRSSVEAYLEPTVHEIKVRRSDLLGDLRKPDKRAAYLAMAGACWYVLGHDARGRPIGHPDEVPTECGVMQVEADGSLCVRREAPRRTVERLPLHLWMALAQAAPVSRADDPPQTGF